MCQDAVLNMGCDYNAFEGVDYYDKCTFTCFLPSAVRAMGGGGQERGKRGGGVFGDGDMVGGGSNNNTGMHG